MIGLSFFSYLYWQSRVKALSVLQYFFHYSALDNKQVKSLRLYDRVTTNKLVSSHRVAMATGPSITPLNPKDSDRNTGIVIQVKATWTKGRFWF